MTKIWERIRESQKILESGKCLSLKKFKVFYLSSKIWKCNRVKGKSVRKSPFGFWVTEKNMKIFPFSILIFVFGVEEKKESFQLEKQN